MRLRNLALLKKASTSVLQLDLSFANNILERIILTRRQITIYLNYRRENIGHPVEESIGCF